MKKGGESRERRGRKNRTDREDKEARRNANPNTRKGGKEKQLDKLGGENEGV